MVLISTNPVMANENENLPHNKIDYTEITLPFQEAEPLAESLIASENKEIPEVQLQGYTNQESISTKDLNAENSKPKLTPYQSWVKDFSDIFTLRGGIHRSLNSEVAQVTEEKTVVKQWLDGDYATGRWFGMRPTFEDHGVTINKEGIIVLNKVGITDLKAGVDITDLKAVVDITDPKAEAGTIDLKAVATVLAAADHR